jgi:predicted flap endonuclease-1-like 5' DNA nuclease
MSYSISDLKGLQSAVVEKMHAVGIASTDDLLTKAGTPAARARLAEQLGVAQEKVLRWANHADLMRVEGVAAGFSDLLEAAGVDTVRELAQRNAANLTEKLAEVNAQLNLTARIPSQDQVAAWIEHAKGLVPKLRY